VDLNKTTIRELKRRAAIHLEEMVASGVKTKEEKGGVGESAFYDMLYLKTIDQERDLIRNRRDIRSTQSRLVQYRTIIAERERYNTRKIGEVKSTTAKKFKRSAKSMMIVAVVAGLMMSLFVAFFIEYIERLKRKGK
jgi:sensor c-di-GMP phosphodiesterase-like protein